METANVGSSEELVRISGLHKTYGDFVAVEQLTLNVGAGEILGFLGPNGAGKTTTMRMLTTYIPPTSGTASVCGYDILEQANDVRRQIGYLPETPPLYDEMRVRSYLRFVAELKGVPRNERAQKIDRAIESCALADRRDQIIGTLSKGLRQRVGIAQAILHDPRVLILDEPTSGLDPNQIIEIRELIRTLGDDRTVILSTHILQEVASVCDRVIIMNQGRLVHDQPLTGGASDSYRVRLAGAAAMPEISDPAIADVQKTGDSWDIKIAAGHSADAALAALVKGGCPIEEFRSVSADLERVFIELTAGAADAERSAA